MTKSRTRVSVTNLAHLLEEVLKKKTFASFPELSEEILKDQSRFAAVSIPSRGIVGVSLATLKTVANVEIDGGFKALDSMRKTLLGLRLEFDSSIAKPASPRSKLGMQKRIKELERSETQLLADLSAISGAFYAAITLARSIIKDSGRADLIKRYRDEEAQLRARASLSLNHIRVVEAQHE